MSPGLGEDVLGALTGTASLMDVVLPSLINELAALPEPLVLVLDDYHLIWNERVHSVLDALLEHLPDTLQLAIATRSQPPLAVDRLRARRQLLDVGPEDQGLLVAHFIHRPADFVAEWQVLGLQIQQLHVHGVRQ